VPVKNETVIFTKLSSIGTITVPKPVTDSFGYATADIFSSESGFVTVQAEVNSGTGMVRGRRTVFYTSGSLNLLPSMILDVDADGDGVYNEPGDFVLLENVTDTEVLVRATVFDRFGFAEPFSEVIFGADVPYRTEVDGACTDGSDTCEVVFPQGVEKFTNSLGQAFVLVRYDANQLRSFQTLFNVLASADNGAFNLVTLFVEPVFISSIALTANPAIVDIEGTSAITAAVTTNLNAPAPDGTVVSFTTTCGAVEPLAQTTDGVAEVQFTAPSSDGICTVTGTVSGVSDSVGITVTSDLRITPETQGADGGNGQVLSFTISGGLAPYTTASTDPTSAFNDNGAGGGTANDGIRNGTEGGIWSTSSISVTIPAGTPSGTVTLNVQDSLGDTVAATITITGAGVLTVTPPGPLDIACGGLAANFTITGGLPPYSVTSLDPLVTISGGPFTSSGDQFTATTAACAGAGLITPVNVVVQDNDVPPSTVTVILNVNDP
jgi:hypothetical protein